MSSDLELAVELVPLVARHSDATLRWMNDPMLMPPLNRLRVITPAEHDAWFAALPARKDLSCFAIETVSPRRHIGNIWLNAIDPEHRKAEVRIMLAPSEQTRGCGSAAITQLCEAAFGRMKLHRLTAFVLGTNPRAARAFEKAGFVAEGTLRDDRWTGSGFVDVRLFARLARR